MFWETLKAGMRPLLLTNPITTAFAFGVPSTTMPTYENVTSAVGGIAEDVKTTASYLSASGVALALLIGYAIYKGKI